jgi:hypothetical protein
MITHHKDARGTARALKSVICRLTFQYHTSCANMATTRSGMKRLGRPSDFADASQEQETAAPVDESTQDTVSVVVQYSPQSPPVAEQSQHQDADYSSEHESQSEQQQQQASQHSNGEEDEEDEAETGEGA